jgi:hypothetical protein
MRLRHQQRLRVLEGKVAQRPAGRPARGRGGGNGQAGDTIRVMMEPVPN